MAQIWTHRAKFQGSGFFPFDMLRYDKCHPLSSEDVSNMGRNMLGERIVQVEKLSGYKDAGFTPERWASFGWVQVEEKSPYKTCLF